MIAIHDMTIYLKYMLQVTWVVYTENVQFKGLKKAAY